MSIVSTKWYFPQLDLRVTYRERLQLDQNNDFTIFATDGLNWSRSARFRDGKVPLGTTC